jgi:hypothetical protein
MKKYILLIAVILLSLSTQAFSQVGINTTKPTPYSGLHVSERMDPTSSAIPDKYNGIIIQRYTQAERDAQLTPNMGTAQNSLMIYNTTENCYNYWNNAETGWKSLCGNLGKSLFTFNCSAVQVKGSYVQGKELTPSNYLSIPVTVTKAGDYTITATTNNGYSFFLSSSFLSTGTYTVQVPGQGTPTAVQTDNLTITTNSTSITCTPPVQVNVLSASGTYTMSCGTATVNGIYKVGVALTASNTITLPVVVTALGSYSITTNTVDGISFSGSGTFTVTGNQNVTLYGTGTPTSTAIKTMTITSDSQGAVSTTCTANVTIVLTSKKILFLGNNVYGRGGSSGTTANMIKSASNFGTNANSIVKIESISSFPALVTNNVTNTNDNNYNPHGAALQTAIDTQKPDVIIISYAYYPTAADGQIIATYLNKGGVVLDMEQEGNSVNIPKFLFSDNTISYTDRGDSVYRFTNTSDPILNGPFGDIRSLLWSSDAAGTAVLNNLPSGDIITYSTDADNAVTPVAGRVSSFRHKTLNYVYLGEGGPVSSNNITGVQDASTVNFPVATSASPNFKPIPRTNMINGSTVYNLHFYANFLAWAFQQAEINGYNK